MGIYRSAHLKSLPPACRRRSYLANVSIAIFFRFLSMLINRRATICYLKIWHGAANSWS
ncbi:hypothetical protein EMIT0158MI4_90007 [Burkholderia ambifaria]